ncbi:MAG TPA: DegT/DnrJ/EryC1/StrS family aminotransferase [Gemmatimonadales bacterium]|nr:DegT/DnrJ/EryC1/StrS family aminotransferase [Gemmatimonadales bacterium]
MRVTVGDLRLGRDERRLLARVIASNRLSYGPFTRDLEKLFARIHGTRSAVFCNSGTSALQIALQALKEKHRWRDGDEVLVPVVTFVATSNIVLHNRMKPVFVDVQPQTYNIDPARISDAMSRKTRCVIPVHLMGLPADMDEVRASRLKVIEDSCETMFARYKGRPVGSLGDIGCFSTYVAHYIVTGVGGFATTSDRGLAVKLRSLMNHGRDSIYLSIDDDDVTGKRLIETVEKRFRFVSPGHSFRCTELEAAIGLAQLRKYRTILKARQSNAAYLMKGLADLQEHLQLPTIPPDRDHVFMLFPLVTKTLRKRPLVNYLERRGIETRDLLPLLNQPVYRGLIRGEFPVARWLLDRGFYIGCHQYLARKQLDYVIDSIHAFFKFR